MNPQPLAKGRIEEGPMPLTLPVILITGLSSLLIFLLSLLLHLGPLEGIPHIQDEIAYLFQAGIFGQGRLYLSPPPLKDLFFFWFIENRDKLYGVFPPGWSLILVPGLLAGIPGLVNPLLSSTLPWIALSIEREIFPERERFYSPLLVPLSPAIVLISASYMAHLLALICFSLLLLSFLRLERVGGLFPPLAAGLFSGLLLLTRPQDLLFGGIPFMIPSFIRSFRKGLEARGFILFSSIFLLFSLALLLYNRSLTGNPFLFPSDRYFSKNPSPYLSKGEGTPYRFTEGCNRLGFGEERGCHTTYGDFGHTPEKALINMGLNLRSLNLNLFGFPLSLLIPAAGLLFSLKKRVIPILFPMITVPLLYSLYWYHGVCFGPRFWSILLIPILLISSSFLNLPALILKGRGRVYPDLLPLAVILALGLAQSLHHYPRISKELKGYWCVEKRFEDVVQENALRNAFVFILFTNSGGRRIYSPMTGIPEVTCNHFLAMGSAFYLNTPTFDGEILFAHLLPEREAFRRALDLYPGRDFYIYTEELSTRENHLMRYDPSVDEWIEVSSAPSSP